MVKTDALGERGDSLIHGSVKGAAAAGAAAIERLLIRILHLDSRGGNRFVVGFINENVIKPAAIRR